MVLKKIYNKLLSNFFIDIHKESFVILNSIFDELKCDNFIEVTHTCPFGFNEFPNRRNIIYKDVLKASFKKPKEKFVVFHNLVGEGVSRKDFKKLIKKFLNFKIGIVIFEHNGYSNDFADNPFLLNIYMKPEEMYLFLNKKPINIRYARGIKDTYRNFFVYYAN